MTWRQKEVLLTWKTRSKRVDDQPKTNLQINTFAHFYQKSKLTIDFVAKLKYNLCQPVFKFGHGVWPSITKGCGAMGVQQQHTFYTYILFLFYFILKPLRNCQNWWAKSTEKNSFQWKKGKVRLSQATLSGWHGANCAHKRKQYYVLLFYSMGTFSRIILRYIFPIKTEALGSHY